MKNQTTFSDVEYQNRKHTTPREAFLDAMNKIIPWERWIAMIAPHYPIWQTGPPDQRDRNNASDVSPANLV